MHRSTQTFSSSAGAGVNHTSNTALNAWAPPHYEQTQLQVWASWRRRPGFKHSDETKSTWTAFRIRGDPLGPLTVAETAESDGKYCFTVSWNRRHENSEQFETLTSWQAKRKAQSPPVEKGWTRLCVWSLHVLDLVMPDLHESDWIA